MSHPSSPSYGLTLRRLRRDPIVRALMREVQLSVGHFMQPHFVVEGLTERTAVPGLTGVYRESPDSLLRQVEEDLQQGVRALLLFGVPKEKSENGAGAEFTGKQIETLRRHFGRDIWIAADVCVCSFTPHGHCGVLSVEQDHVANAASVEVLARVALRYAQAGADCVAPSDMMDGRIAAIRGVLETHSLDHVTLMSYAAKFHSALYGPFREAADSAPKSALRDRATYQIDPARPSDALASVERDVREGADILLVKPGLPYLDIITRLRPRLHQPLAAYEVSGEFAAVELLAREGLANAARAHVECWTALARAGAQLIISYGARYARRWIGECAP